MAHERRREAPRINQSSVQEVLRSQQRQWWRRHTRRLRASWARPSAWRPKAVRTVKERRREGGARAGRGLGRRLTASPSLRAVRVRRCAGCRTGWWAGSSAGCSRLGYSPASPAGRSGSGGPGCQCLRQLRRSGARREIAMSLADEMRPPKLSTPRRNSLCSEIYAAPWRRATAARPRCRPCELPMETSESARRVWQLPAVQDAHRPGCWPCAGGP